MAKYRFRGALNAAVFPILAGLQGRTVINPAIDPNVRTPQAFHGTEESSQVGIPQIVYCENVVPTAEGLQSVGYKELVEGVGAVGTSTFDQAMVLRDEDENAYLFAPGNGNNWVLNFSTLEWAQINPLSLPQGTPVSRAYVNGRTFICYAGYGVYEYSPTAGGSISAVTLDLPSGITDADISAIGASSNYLLLATTITVIGSSPIDPTDCNPDNGAGAFQVTPQDVKGQIVALVSTSGGFIIWTSLNALAAAYTSNARAPFSYKELANGGGLKKIEHVTLDQVSGAQYAWTTAGLIKATLQGAESVSTEVTDFIAGRVNNYWDSTTKTVIVEEESAAEFFVKISLVSSRFLVLSYGSTEVAGIALFNDALVYDVYLKRWGKLRLPHTDCFIWQFSDDIAVLTSGNPGTTTSKLALGILQIDGTVKLALMDYNKDADHAGVLILGKHQLLRARWIQHQLTSVEGAYGQAYTGVPVLYNGKRVQELLIDAIRVTNTPDTRVTNTGDRRIARLQLLDSFRAYIAVSYDGLNLQAATGMNINSTVGKSVVYGALKTGLNYDLIFEGTFALSSYISEVTTDGDI